MNCGDDSVCCDLPGSIQAELRVLGVGCAARCIRPGEYPTVTPAYFNPRPADRIEICFPVIILNLERSVERLILFWR